MAFGSLCDPSAGVAAVLQIEHGQAEVPGVAAGTGVLVGVGAGGTGVFVAGTGVLVGGTGVAVAVAGTGVLVGGTGVGVAVGVSVGTGVVDACSTSTQSPSPPLLLPAGLNCRVPTFANGEPAIGTNT